MTNRELFALYSVLVDLQHVQGSPRFAFAVAKNLELLRGPVAVLAEPFDVPADYKGYEAARVKLCEKHGERDAEGRLITRDGAYVVSDPDAFQRDWNLLLQEWQPALNAYRRACAEFQERLDATAPALALAKIAVEDFPELTPEIMSLLLPLVDV